MYCCSYNMCVVLHVLCLIDIRVRCWRCELCDLFSVVCCWCCWVIENAPWVTVAGTDGLGVPVPKGMSRHRRIDSCLKPACVMEIVAGAVAKNMWQLQTDRW